MKTLYLEAEKILTGKVKLVRGNPTTETVSVTSIVTRDGKSEVKEIEANIQFSGSEFSFRWDSKGYLKDDEMFIPVILMLSGSQQYSKLRVVLYRPKLEVEAVGADDQPLPGIVCRVIIQVDEGFESKRKWREDYTINARGEKELVLTTDGNGKIVIENLPVGNIQLDWDPPYGLIDANSWVKSDGYSLMGPKRKAKLHKLPMVHFVWWGNPKNASDYQASATALPNAMGQLQKKITVFSGLDHTDVDVPKIQVNYWCQHDATTLHGWLSTNVTVRKITKLSDLMMEDGHAIHGVFMGRGKTLDGIVDTLSKYYMYSAAKDLIELCVLYKYGGYYFDTTMLMPEKKADFPDKFTPEPKNDSGEPELRFPKTIGGGPYLYLRNDRSIFGTLSGGMRSKMDGLDVFVSANIDVWAAYFPPRSDALLMMIDSYIERCVNLGLDEYPSKQIISIDRIIGTSWNPEWNGTTMDNFLTKICKTSKKYGVDGTADKGGTNFKSGWLKSSEMVEGSATTVHFEQADIGRILQINSGNNKGRYKIKAIVDQENITVDPIAPAPGVTGFPESDTVMDFDILEDLVVESGTKGQARKGATEFTILYPDGEAGVTFKGNIKGKSLRITSDNNKGEYKIDEFGQRMIGTADRTCKDGQFPSGSDTFTSESAAFKETDVGMAIKLKSDTGAMHREIIKVKGPKEVQVDRKFSEDGQNAEFEIRKKERYIVVAKSHKFDKDDNAMDWEIVNSNPGMTARNKMIGNLIIASVQDGLLTYCFEYKNKDLPDDNGVRDELFKLTWDTKKPDDAFKEKYYPAPVQAYLPEFNDMPKAHSGSWRRTASS